MKITTASFLLSVALATTASAVDTKTTNVRGETKPRRRRLQQQDPCTLTFQETQYWDDTPEPSRADTAGSRRLKKGSAIKEKKQWVCELSEADAAAVDARFVVVEGLDDDFIQANEIKSAKSTILVEGESLAQDHMYVANTATTIVGEKNKIKVVKPENDGRRLSTGTRTVLVVRVSSTSDGRATSASASQLANDIFDDSVSLKSHYTACSYGKLTFQKATGNNIVNGVVSVNLNSNVVGVESDTVRDRMQSAANSLVGTTIQSAYNHVMFCIPPGTVDGGSSGWFAYAGVGSWYSVFNDDACKYVSAQMHELGHNFNLAHSNEAGEAYRDQTGMMGISYGEDDTKMCFNPVKSWQLGWYSDRQKDLNPATEAPYQTTMVGVAGYGTAASNEMVVIRIGNAETSSGVAWDYYIGYNAQYGINENTKEGGNTVTVTRREANTAYKTSDLLAKLDLGGTYSITNFRGSGNKLNIKFKSRVSGMEKAVVEVYFDGLQGTYPTQAPTEPCSSGEAYFELDLKFDYWAPEDNSWKLIQDQSGVQIGSGGNYGRDAPAYYSVCLNTGTAYTWTLTDNFGDGICCGAGNGEYVGYVNGVEIFRGGVAVDFVNKQAVEKFTTPGGGPSPTSPPTRMPTKSPTPPPIPSPTPPPIPAPIPAPVPAPIPAPTSAPGPSGSCTTGKTMFDLALQFDYWAPDDNSWTLKDSKGVILMSGSGYARNAVDNKSMCLTNAAQYTFTLLDAWGDGICCSNGQGYFRGKLDGKEIFSGGEGTGKQVDKVFIVPGAPAPTPMPTKSPTLLPTKAPVSVPTSAAGSCSTGKKEFVLDLQFDYWAPDDNSWTLKTGSTTVASGNNYARNAVDKRTLCLDNGKTYVFALADNWGDGICCTHGQGFYKGFLAGSQIFSGGQGFGKLAEHSFTV